MIGDNIMLQPRHYRTAEKILDILLPHLANQSRFCVSVGGESGSGKSVTAICLANLLNQQATPTVVLHQDDYFKLPPETNRQARARDLGHVGLAEVNMELIENHIAAFKQYQKEIVKPLVLFKENLIENETVSFEHCKVLIFEGTYSSLLPVDFRVFMGRNYIQSHEQRLARGRDVFDDNLNNILAIEHKIISPHAAIANVYVDANYDVCATKNNPAL